MPLVASFPFTFIGRTTLGRIDRPYALVLAYSKARKKWQPLEMVVDTGADYTLFPARYAPVLGIDVKKDCTVESTKGIGGSETVYQYHGLPIRIGTWERSIPVGFLGRDDIPPLLGRLGCLEVFKLTFDDKKCRFEIR